MPFRREHGEQFLARRKNRPMFFIDIAVPRDVSPEMGKLDGIFTYDIDDLQQAVFDHITKNRRRKKPSSQKRSLLVKSSASKLAADA